MLGMQVCHNASMICMSEVEKLQTLHQFQRDFPAISLLVQMQQRRLVTGICFYTAVVVTTSLLHASPLMCSDSPQTSSCLVTFSLSLSPLSFLVRNYPLPIPQAASLAGSRYLLYGSGRGSEAKSAASGWTRKSFWNFLFLYLSNCI